MKITSRLILFPIEGALYPETMGDEDGQCYGLLVVTPQTIEVHRQIRQSLMPLVAFGDARISASTGIVELFEELPPFLETFADSESPVLLPPSEEASKFAADLWENAQEERHKIIRYEGLRTVISRDGDVRLTFYQKHVNEQLQSPELGPLFKELMNLPEQDLIALLWDAPDVPEGWNKTEGTVKDFFHELIEWNKGVNQRVPEMDRFENTPPPQLPTLGSDGD